MTHARNICTFIELHSAPFRLHTFHIYFLQVFGNVLYTSFNSIYWLKNVVSLLPYFLFLFTNSFTMAGRRIVSPVVCTFLSLIIYLKTSTGASKYLSLSLMKCCEILNQDLQSLNIPWNNTSIVFMFWMWSFKYLLICNGFLLLLTNIKIYNLGWKT